MLFIEIGEAKVEPSKFAKFSAKTIEQSAIEKLVMAETRGASDGQLTATKGRDTGFVGDAVADGDLDDEMLYFAGSDWPTANGGTAGMRQQIPEQIVIRVRSHSDSLIKDQYDG